MDSIKIATDDEKRHKGKEMNCTLSAAGKTSPAETLEASESESEREIIMSGLDQKRTKNHWTETEDEMLTQLIEEANNENQEDAMLTQLVEEANNENQEDAMLTQLIEEANNENPKRIKWTNIATHMTGRTGKQCRERWQNHLRPDLKKGSWSKEEDVKIMKLQRKIGNKWSKIAEELPGRTDNAVKNRWYAGIRRKKDPASNAFDQTNSLCKKWEDSDMLETKTSSTGSTRARRAKKGNTKPKVVKMRQQRKKARGQNKKTTVRRSKPAMQLPGDHSTQSSNMKALKPSSVQNNHANDGKFPVPIFVGGNARTDVPHPTPQLLDKNQIKKEDDTLNNPILQDFSFEDIVTFEETANRNNRNTIPANLDFEFEDRTKLVQDINYTPGGPNDTSTSNWIVDGSFSASTVMHQELCTPLRLSDSQNISFDLSVQESTESSAGSAPPVPHEFSFDKFCEV